MTLHIFNCIIASALLVLSVAPSLHAQEITLAIVGTNTTHDASFNSLPPVENCCTGFSDTDGLGFGFEVSLPASTNADGVMLIPHLGYQHMPVSFQAFSTEKAFTGGVVSGTALFRHTLDVSWTVVTIGARLEYPILSGCFIGVGVNGNFFATGRYQQTETLEQPSNIVFETGTRVRLDRNGYIRENRQLVWNASGLLRLRLIEPSEDRVGLDLFSRYSMPLQSLFVPQTWSKGTAGSGNEYYIDHYTVYLFSVGLGIVL